MMLDINTLDFKYANDSDFKKNVDENFDILKGRYKYFGSDSHVEELVENFVTMYAEQEPSAHTDSFFHRSVKSYIKMNSPRIGTLFDALQFKYDETLKQITNVEATHNDINKSTTDTSNADTKSTTDDGRKTTTETDNNTNGLTSSDTTNKLTDNSVHSDESSVNVNGSNHTVGTDKGNTDTTTSGTTGNTAIEKKYTAVDVATEGSGFDSDGTLLDGKRVNTATGTSGSSDNSTHDNKTGSDVSNNTNTQSENTSSVKGDVINKTDATAHNNTAVTGTTVSSVDGQLVVDTLGGQSKSVVDGSNNGSNNSETTQEGLAILKADAYKKFYDAYTNLDLEFLKGMSYLFVQY